MFINSWGGGKPAGKCLGHLTRGLSERLSLMSQPTRLRHQTNKDKAYWWLNQQVGKRSNKIRLPNLNRLGGRGC